MEFPILDLMAVTSLPGNFLKRFDIGWLTILIFSLLFTLGSVLFYVCWLKVKNGVKRDCIWIIMVLLIIWLESLIVWSDKTISDVYTTILQDIYALLFLLVTILALEAQKRIRNEKERGDAKHGEQVEEEPEKAAE